MAGSAPGRRVPVAAVIALTAAAWWLSVGRMQGMNAGPGVALGGLGWFAATWLLMMAAMMLPVIAPVLVAVCFEESRRGFAVRPVLAGLAFVMCYLLVWVLVGAVSYAVLRAGRAVAGSAFEWHRGGQWLSVAVIFAAGAYQLSATKRRWLPRCRVPLPPVRSFRGGGEAGLRAGLRCLASSWALMLVLFAVGAMSLVWMGLIAALTAAERLLPLVSAARVAAAAVLLALAVGVAVMPESVPGFTVPSSVASQRVMMRMMP